MNELTEALDLLKYALGRLECCNSPTCSACQERDKDRQRARELTELLGAIPALVARVRSEQMQALRAFSAQDYQTARQHAANATRELERLDTGFFTERLREVPGAPPATLRVVRFDGLRGWTLRSDLTGALLDSGIVLEQPPGAPRPTEQIITDSCYYQLRLLAQGQGVVRLQTIGVNPHEVEDDGECA